MDFKKTKVVAISGIIGTVFFATLAIMPSGSGEINQLSPQEVSNFKSETGVTIAINEVIIRVPNIVSLDPTRIAVIKNGVVVNTVRVKKNWTGVESDAWQLPPDTWGIFSDSATAGDVYRNGSFIRVTVPDEEPK